MMTDANTFFAAWQPWQVAMAGTVAAEMIRHGIGPEQLRDLVREHLLDHVLPEAEKSAAKLGGAPPRSPIRARPRPADVRRQSGQADAEHRLGACPKCGAEVWGIKKCPHIAPPWSTFFVCDNDDCDYHGRSRLAVEQLRRRWPDGAEAD